MPKAKRTKQETTIVPWNLCQYSTIPDTEPKKHATRGCKCGILTSHIVPYNTLQKNISEYDDYIIFRDRSVFSEYSGPFAQTEHYKNLSQDERNAFLRSVENDIYDDSLLNQTMAQMKEDSKETGCLFCQIVVRSIWLVMIGERMPHYAPCNISTSCSLKFVPINYRFKSYLNLKVLFTQNYVQKFKPKLKLLEHTHKVDEVKQCERHWGVDKLTLANKQNDPVYQCSKKEREHRHIDKYTLHRDTPHVGMLGEESAHSCPPLKALISSFVQLMQEYASLDQVQFGLPGIGCYAILEDGSKMRVALKILKRLFDIFTVESSKKNLEYFYRLQNFWTKVLKEFYPCKEKTQEVEDLLFLASLTI